MLRTLTDEELIQEYGDPFKYLQEDGSVDAVWKVAILDSFWLPRPLQLSWDNTKSARKVSCHKRVVRELERIFKRIDFDSEARESINDYGGCYMWRPNKNNPKKLSKHCWGIAIDLDCRDNPNGGTPHMHPRIIEYFAMEGWVWGGTFPTPDGMHFEKGMPK